MFNEQALIRTELSAGPTGPQAERLCRVPNVADADHIHLRWTDVQAGYGATGPTFLGPSRN